LSISQNLPRIVQSINVSCPICKARKEIDIPLEIINESKHLTTVSISEGMICEHHFQLFIDKNFMIRGYQKVDFQVNDVKTPNSKMSLEDIYQEFWEFIDNDNSTFLPYISKDKRRSS